MEFLMIKKRSFLGYFLSGIIASVAFSPSIYSVRSVDQIEDELIRIEQKWEKWCCDLAKNTDQRTACVNRAVDEDLDKSLDRLAKIQNELPEYGQTLDEQQRVVNVTETVPRIKSCLRLLQRYTHITQPDTRSDQKLIEQMNSLAQDLKGDVDTMQRNGFRFPLAKVSKRVGYLDRRVAQLFVALNQKDV